MLLKCFGIGMYKLPLIQNFALSPILNFYDTQMTELPVSSTYAGCLGGYNPSQGLHVRRSLPNMAHSMLVNEPAKIYPYHLLLITNYRLPADVDRCNLEVCLEVFINNY